MTKMSAMAMMLTATSPRLNCLSLALKAEYTDGGQAVNQILRPEAGNNDRGGARAHYYFLPSIQLSATTVKEKIMPIVVIISSRTV